MHKIFTLFKREYRSAVRTKSFIISLVLVPIMMGGGFLAMIIMENKKDTEDKHFVVMDHTHRMKEFLQEAVDKRNREEIFHSRTGEKTEPAFIVEFTEPDQQDPAGQQLALSNRVKSSELHAFLEIGPGFINGRENDTATYLKYYSEHMFNDPYRGWFSDVLNKQAQIFRAAELDLDEEQTRHLTQWTGVTGMGLVTVDKKTGEQLEAERSNELQAILVPYVMLILMFMMVMMSAFPLLNAVMEEKNEKIAEVLLGAITPFQFMMGKVLGGIGVSLTIIAIYVAAGAFTMTYLGMESIIPYDVLPWFFSPYLPGHYSGHYSHVPDHACDPGPDRTNGHNTCTDPVFYPFDHGGQTGNDRDHSCLAAGGGLGRGYPLHAVFRVDRGAGLQDGHPDPGTETHGFQPVQVCIQIVILSI
jgi:ABC-2 type transport system permease protein